MREQDILCCMRSMSNAHQSGQELMSKYSKALTSFVTRKAAFDAFYKSEESEPYIFFHNAAGTRPLQMRFCGDEIFCDHGSLTIVFQCNDYTKIQDRAYKKHYEQVETAISY